MRTIREVLRLKWEKGLSIKKISQSCKIARSTITDYLSRAKRAGLTWPLPPELDDSRLEALLYPARRRWAGEARHARDGVHPG